MDSSKLGIEKFDGSDFNFWKMQIEDYLYQKDLHEPLTGVKSKFHDGGEVETQGSSGSRVDLVDFVKKRGVQHREGEDYVRSVEGTVKHV